MGSGARGATISRAPAGARAAGRSAPDPHALYVGSAGEQTFGILHPPVGEARGQAVLIVPPFGNADNGSYMPRRVWAQRLAAAGHPTLRIDLPCSGDSPGGPRDGDVLGAWVRGVASAADWLRGRYGRRVAAIGLGLGGLICCLAAERGAAIDDLVLWATPARGRQFVRELTVFERMLAANVAVASSATSPSSSPPPRPGRPSESAEAVESAGFVLAPDTVAALRAVDLGTLRLPDGPARRALLLDRDGMAPDRRLSAALQSAGVEVQEAPGPGFWLMMAAPYESQAPSATMTTVDRWLADGPQGADGASAAAEPVPAAESVTIAAGDGCVRERPVGIGHRSGTALGILTEPLDAEPDPRLTLVLVNSGALRRMGPNRMWTELARRWAARGLPVLRVDLSREGDLSPAVLGRWHSANARPGDIEWDHFEVGFGDQYTSAIDFLAARGSTGRFLVVGLSSGGYWSLQQVLGDDRVAAGVLVNPGRLTWSEQERVARDAGKVRDAEAWQRMLRGDIPAQRVVHAARSVLRSRLRSRAGAGSAGADKVVPEIVDRLAAADQHLTFLFGPGEPLPRALRASGDLERLEDSPNVTIEWLDSPGMAHVLESVSLQHAAHGLLDRAIERALAHAGVAA